jgi:hypothetical protein
MKPGLSPELIDTLVLLLYGALVGAGVVGLVWWLG